MKLRLSIGLLFFLSLVQVHSFSKFDGDYVDGPGIFSNSGIRGPRFSKQILAMKEIANKRPDIVTLVEYGKSIKGQTLTALILEPKNMPVTKFALVTGATHGNEYLNIADRLTGALLDSPSEVLENYIASGGALLVVPIVNPDGYDRRRRGNSRRVDLNRDWPNTKSPQPSQFEEPETLALSQLVERYLNSHPFTQLNFALDYHCCVDGMLLKPWGYQKGVYMTQQETTRFKNFIDPMIKYFPSPGKVGTPPDLLYSADGTTLDYWYDKYGAVSLTYEGTRRREKDYLQFHVLWWEDILRNL
ncbi:MAG: DUF2817 domain-containing protein [Halobacteriovoraceae bacterium]|nr:DUF2817 domain-containing protein [Halobacteriovoraceae bacterium]